MNVQFVHAPVHSPEQVREIIAEAKAIALEHAEDAPTAACVFREACRLLGARVSTTLMQEPVPVQLPHMAIPRNRH